MHILSILTSFTAGGAEVLVSNLSGAFVGAGHPSTVVALSPAAAIGNDAGIERAQRAKIAAEGGATRLLGISDRRNVIAGVWAMRRLLRAERPDIVHAHTARALPMLWLAGVRCPVVLTHHNSKLSFPPQMFALFDRIVGSYVAIGRDCEKLLAAHVRRPVTPIVNAAGAGFLAAEGRKAIGEPATILAVGALTDQKNYPMLIEAAARLRHRCAARQHFRLRIAGGGALMADLEARAAALNAGKYVELLGNRSDVAELMRGADLFVNASHYEGMPIAMLEALQSALPVVATDVAGTRDLIVSGHNGLLVRPGDPDALAAALMTLLSQPDIYARLSAAALATGRRYELGTCARAHLDLYARLRRGAPGGAAAGQAGAGRGAMMPRGATPVQKD
ncbi:glycosyltransferase [Sphingopyxis indica]|uniref:glycosyltransferase n=1 Tax=Sphingopyxis indica TaxID=436663 RepID=UPI0029394AF0|nr:glycosyltransferase [Sphingopyxis indica]WOF43556.1 glycosyltransferase [Sphingopyxis indica]